MVKRILTLLLFTGLAAISLAAVEYGKLDYAAVSIPETDFKWDDAVQVFRTKLEIPAEGKYNLYFDMAAVERSSVTLRIDGKEIPALDLPGTARTPGRFLRIRDIRRASFLCFGPLPGKWASIIIISYF